MYDGPEDASVTAVTTGNGCDVLYSLVSIPKSAKLLLPRRIPHVELDGPTVGVERKRTDFYTKRCCQGQEKEQPASIHLKPMYRFLDIILIYA